MVSLTHFSGITLIFHVSMWHTQPPADLTNQNSQQELQIISNFWGSDLEELISHDGSGDAHCYNHLTQYASGAQFLIQMEILVSNYWKSSNTVPKPFAAFS